MLVVANRGASLNIDTLTCRRCDPKLKNVAYWNISALKRSKWIQKIQKNPENSNSLACLVAKHMGHLNCFVDKIMVQLLISMGRFLGSLYTQSIIR